MEIKLRPYQEECVGIIDSMESGTGLVALFTGAGKTVIFSRIRRRGRMLILSHREELVYQPKKYFDCSYGVERAEEHSDGEEVISASVQSLVRRLDRFSPDDFDIIVTDEAHHAVAPSYKKIYDYFKPRLHIGFTATPNRGDKLRLGEVYSKVIFERDIRWGIANGYLSNIRCFRVDVGYQLRNVKTSMGDFAQNSLAKAVDTPTFNNTVADIYREKAVGPTLIFAASVAHARHISKLIPHSAVITADTQDRAGILQDFRDGHIRCLVNCMVLTEGTDLPMVGTVIMCRPTQNASLYTQCVGRGTRLSEGKDSLVLIDCVGDSRLPLCTAPILFNLEQDRADKKCDGRLLTDIMAEVEEEAEKPDMDEGRIKPGYWMQFLEEVRLFQAESAYDLHNIYFTKGYDGSLICPLGDGWTVKVGAEDMVGNTNFSVIQHDRVVREVRGIPMQAALDIAFSTLSSSFKSASALWDGASVKVWGNKPVSDRQKACIRRLCPGQAFRFSTMTRGDASLLIGRMMELQKAKK